MRNAPPSTPRPASPRNPPGATVTFVLDIGLTPDQLHAYYRGAVQAVVATARDGRSVSLPLRVLRPFVTHVGIRGTFAVTVDPHHRMLGIERLPER